jgi:hypothetical protein
MNDQHIIDKIRARNTGQKFQTKITREDAEALLQCRVESRPPSEGRIKIWVRRFNNNPSPTRGYNIEESKKYPITLSTNSKQLLDGIHRLEGFIRSKEKEFYTYVEFINL